MRIPQLREFTGSITLKCQAIVTDPIAFLHASHYSQLVLSQTLVDMLTFPARSDLKEQAGAIQTYLLVELPFHHADEDEDLLALLLRSGAMTGDLGVQLSALRAAHARDRELAQRMLEGLTALSVGEEPARVVEFLQTAFAFAEHLRHHVIWENRTLLPLADELLRAGDLADLGHRMLERRKALVEP